MTNRKLVALWVKPELKDKLKEVARTERRSVSNLVEGFVLQGLEEK